MAGGQRHRIPDGKSRSRCGETPLRSGHRYPRMGLAGRGDGGVLPRSERCADRCRGPHGGQHKQGDGSFEPVFGRVCPDRHPGPAGALRVQGELEGYRVRTRQGQQHADIPLGPDPLQKRQRFRVVAHAVHPGAVPYGHPDAQRPVQIGHPFGGPVAEDIGLVQQSRHALRRPSRRGQRSYVPYGDGTLPCHGGLRGVRRDAFGLGRRRHWSRGDLCRGTAAVRRRGGRGARGAIPSDDLIRRTARQGPCSSACGWRAPS